MEWTVVRENGSENDQQVEEGTRRGNTDGDAGNNHVDGEQVVGETIAKEEETGLEHHGQAFHDEVEMPHLHSVHLALSISTAVDDRSAHLHLGITFEPLLTQHREERGEKGSGQTGVKYGSDADSVGTRTSPLKGGGSGTSCDMPTERGVGVVGYNLEKAVAQLRVIRLEIGLNSDNKSGCDGRE